MNSNSSLTLSKNFHNEISSNKDELTHDLNEESLFLMKCANSAPQRSNSLIQLSSSEIKNGILKMPNESQKQNVSFQARRIKFELNEESSNSECAQHEKNLKNTRSIETQTIIVKQTNIRKIKKRARFLPLSSLSKRERIFTYKLGFILFTFVFSWFPFSILWSLISICSYDCVPLMLYRLSFWLSRLNSLFTPFILLYNNKKYRKSFILLRKKCFIKSFCFWFPSEPNRNKRLC